LIKTNHQLTQKIIDHKRSQAALSESEKRCHTLFDEAPDAIFLIQMDDRILDANLAAATMLGYTREELQTMTVVDIQAPEVRGTAGETMKNELTLGKTFQGLDVHRDGTLIPVEIHNNKMVINDDEIVLSIVRDITERKKFESRLRQSQKMEAIGTLAGGIAHDFNNILSGIFGYSELAVANIHDPEQAKRYISQIIHNSKRAADLVRQILTFSRQSRYKKHPVSIHTVVTEALQLLRSLIPANIEIEKRLDSQAIVLADSTKIHQLIINLCTNAYHAIGKAGGKITLSLTRKIISESTPIQNDTISAGTYLALEIRDTGTGMDEKTMKKAFDPYFTTKAVGKGTGLGLALVQAIVKEHDGFMDVHSQPEKGSCFCIFLPVFEEKPPGHALPDDLPAPVNGNERIMVVDDEQAIREVTGEFLSNYGYTVDLFKNGEDALEEFKRDPDKYDLIVTDMAMPRMTGDKLAVELIKKNPGLPIFLCTGFSENMSRETAASLGISRLIIKPLELKCLARDIRQVLDTISRDQNRT
jgi:PAS domain S-box-containing protein